MARTAPIDPQAAAITKRLDTLAERSPELAEPIAFYRAALPALRAAQAAVEPVNLAPETAQSKLAAGIPLLLGEALPLDPEATRTLFIHLCRIIEEVGAPSLVGDKKGGWPFRFASKSRPDPAQLLEQARNGNEAALRAMAAGQIRRAVEQYQLDLLAVWSALTSGDTHAIELTIRDLKLDGDLLRTLAQSSLKPALRAWAQELRHQIALGQWRRGQCPICGHPPALAEIQGKEGARHLRCGICGADWSYPRLKCAFCANEKYKLLGYITVEGEEEKYSLQTCDECHNYLKVVVTFEPTPVDFLPIEDLATLYLDIIAMERGYSH